MRISIAIVGNGGAAAETVRALRANGYDGQIHLFADNEHAPYNPMLGPYLVAGRIPLERAFPFGDQTTFYDDNRVTAHLGHRIVHLDAEARTLTTASGETYEYERCVVATGARPSVPPVPGLREALAADGAAGALSRRVFTIQTLDDALTLKRAVDELRPDSAPERFPGGDSAAGAAPPQGAAAGDSAAGVAQAAGDRPRAAVVGASFAGIKIAAVLHEMGFRVTLIEREPSILPLSAHPECARIMEVRLLEEGYRLRLGAALTRVEAAPDGVRLEFGALPGAADPGGAGGTACDESPTHEVTDLVVVCTGNRPSLSFLAPGQIDTGVGILVDEQMRSNIPTLYAAGDVAQGKNPLSGRHEIIGLWASARYQGRSAGRSLAGAPVDYRGSVPHNITHVGSMLFASVGCMNDYDQMVVCREGDTYQVRVWQDGRLAGVNLLDCCLTAGVTKQAILKAATGVTSEMEATWTSFSG
jgi:NADPH-dependent 2,4-dienoyl-CoA reductase/sulfur reductase-like enzyme